MRFPALLLSLALAAPLPAQANDYAGLRVFSGSVGAPTPLTCGTPFTCAPFTFTAPSGGSVNAIVTGTLNGVYALAASFDTASLGCLPLPFTGLVNSLALPPFSMFTVVAGTTAVPDNGRCNGGFAAISLGTIPPGLPPGSVAFQAIAETPLSSGGTGFALTHAVVMSF